MIYHSIRFTIRPNAPRDQVEVAFEHLRRCGREIKAVESFCVGRDVGGEFEYGATYVLKDIRAYREYMLSPLHRRTDEVGLPVVGNMVSMDITDDEDLNIGHKIREIHSSRFASDPELVGLVEDLGSYRGSGVPGKKTARA
jgi:Stress responsive A/B Barrel Domain